MPVMTTALAMLDATSAVATANAARLASRVVADVWAMYLAGPPHLVGSHCPDSPHVCRDCVKLRAIVSPSQRSLKVVTHDFATVLPVCHGEM